VRAVCAQLAEALVRYVVDLSERFGVPCACESVGRLMTFDRRSAVTEGMVRCAPPTSVPLLADLPIDVGVVRHAWRSVMYRVCVCRL
jgi:hypothetical protein